MLRIGIADFRQPTLLILGDAESLAWLAVQFDGGQNVDFSSIQDVSLQSHFDLQVLCTPHGGGLQGDKGRLTWVMSPSDARNFAMQLRGLVDSSLPAHAYLDAHPNLTGLEVVASLGEYDSNDVFQDVV